MSLAPAVVRRGTAWARRMRYAVELASPRRYLFVMSHMRSYSTLLCHILNNNAEIDGYVEMHKPYTKQLDLLELTLRVRHTTGDRLRGRYVVDKVLHNYDMTPEVLGREDVYALYSIRDPESAVRSILAMGLKRKKPDWKSDPEKVVKHYVKRLERLVQDSIQTKARSLYFDAQLLVDEPERVLPKLSSFLELKAPLTPDYQTADLTGQWKFGDASKYIGAGQIVTQREDHSGLVIPDDLMTKARDAHQRCRAALASNCSTTVDL